MDIKDIKVGMKVKLLGKHGLYDNYNNIEDWYKKYNDFEDVRQIKEQGFGVITKIKEYREVWVSDGINNDSWGFLPSDLEPYESIDKLDKTKY